MRTSMIVTLCLATAIGGACSQAREAGGDAGLEDAGWPVDGEVALDATVPTDASPADGGAGACGTRGAAPCPSGQVCIFALGSCGADDVGGTCTTPPEVCPDVVMPVCGCDGVTYENPCSATAAGASVAQEGACGTTCDRRDVRCRVAEPECPDGQTASVVAGCYGPCVAMEACECAEAAACPDPDHYTCHLSTMRCGPYL